MDAPKTARIKGIYSALTREGQRRPLLDSPSGFFNASEISPERILVMPLNQDYVPVGPSQSFSRHEFLRAFRLEPELWYKLVTQRVARADSYRRSERYLEARLEYKGALAIDEENIRANFGLALVYLAERQLPQARYVFARLVTLDEAFQPEHKHLFNEFGIALRKCALYPEALQFYARAAQLSGGDANLWVNMARAHFENNDAQAACAALARTLGTEPDHPEALAFLRFLLRRGIAPEDQAQAALFRRIVSEEWGPAARQ